MAMPIQTAFPTKTASAQVTVLGRESIVVNRGGSPTAGASIREHSKPPVAAGGNISARYVSALKGVPS